MTETCLIAQIHGRVQGVGFRYYTRLKARELGICGWVRNLPDGSVEACLCGSADQIRAMQQWLSHGPSYANVTDIKYSPTENIHCDNTFTVR